MYRLNIAFTAHRSARVCIEDAMAHARKRKVYGEPLMELSIIRHKLGQMVRLVESQQAWIESLVYQLNQLSDADGTALLGGQTALLKAHCGITLEFVAREAVQILGGLGYTRGGAGERSVCSLSLCLLLLVIYLFQLSSSLCIAYCVCVCVTSGSESNALGERLRASQSPVEAKK